MSPRRRTPTLVAEEAAASASDASAAWQAAVSALFEAVRVYREPVTRDTRALKRRADEYAGAAATAQTSAEAASAEAERARQAVEEIESLTETAGESETQARDSLGRATDWARSAWAVSSSLEAAAASGATALAAATAQAVLKPPLDRGSLGEATTRAAAEARTSDAEKQVARAAEAKTEALFAAWPGAQEMTPADARAQLDDDLLSGQPDALGAARAASAMAHSWANDAAIEAAAAHAALRRAEARGAAGQAPAARPSVSAGALDPWEKHTDALRVGPIPSQRELAVVASIAAVGAVVSLAGLLVAADEGGSLGWIVALAVSVALAGFCVVALVLAQQHRREKLSTVSDSAFALSRQVDELDTGAEGAADPVALADVGRRLRRMMADAGAREEADAIDDTVARLTARHLQRSPSTQTPPPASA